MMDVWNDEYDFGKSDRFIKKRNWEKSLSEPDLTDPFIVNQRFAIKNPSEYISIDQLHYFRRKKPTDCHTKSNICLYDKDKPVLPFSVIKSEYRWRYKEPLSFLKSGLTRKATSLKLEGYMDIETEHKAKYIQYNKEQISRGRPPAIRNPENLILVGDLEHNPEYKSSFVRHPISERQKIYSPIETFQIHGNIEVTKKPLSMSSVDLQHSEQPPTTIDKANTISVSLPAEFKTEAQKCHLKLEGEMSYLPEYRSQFIPFDVEKSHLIPQLSNIHFNGTFTGIPEYRENYKFYDSYSKSAPIKKADHLVLNGQIESFPEYKEQFKGPDKSCRQKTESLKTEDHLKPEGDFGKDVPEYFESFKDPQVRYQMPEKGKCREPYLRLKGKIEFNPEYRSTYLDYPRSRPICKKSTSSFKIAGTKSKSPFGSPRKRFQSTSPLKFCDPNQDLPLTKQPEYRKAKYIYQIRERTPTTRQIAEVQGTVQPLKKDKFSDVLNVTHLENLNKHSPRSRRQSVTGSSSIKGNLENIEHLGEILPKTTPKYGRRASVSRNTKLIRGKSSIVEGNAKYNKTDDSSTIIDDPFVVLDEPCKKNAWMKKTWYES